MHSQEWLGFDDSGHSCEELYGLYVKFMDDAQARILQDCKPGDSRDAMLRHCRPLPLEHFEARLEAMRRTPRQFARLVGRLQRGYRCLAD